MTNASVNGTGSATVSQRSFAVSAGRVAVAHSFTNGRATSVGGTASFAGDGSATAQNGSLSATANSGVTGAVGGSGSGKVAARSHEVSVAIDTPSGVKSFTNSNGGVKGSTTGGDTATGSFQAGGTATAANGSGLGSTAQSSVFGGLTGDGNGAARGHAASYSAADMTSQGLQSASLSVGRVSATQNAFGSYDASGASSGNGYATTPIGAGPGSVASRSGVDGSVDGAGIAASFSSNRSAAGVGTVNGTTTVFGASVSRGELAAGGSGAAGFGSSGRAGVSLADATGAPVASIGVNSSARGSLPGVSGAPFDAIGAGGASATGNSNTGSVSTGANVNESAFGHPALSNPAVTVAGARGVGSAGVAVTP
ncbi:MAG: hypothetical protein ACREFP_21305 [Acetobacteraceae bacterium]